MRPERLSIENECFKDLREKLDAMLNLAFDRMRRMGLDAGRVTAKVDIQAPKITENDREVWKPEFKCEVGVSMPLKGKIRASTPAGLKMMANPNGSGYVIATDNYTFLDLLEEQPPEPPDGEEEGEEPGYALGPNGPRKRHTSNMEKWRGPSAEGRAEAPC